MKMMRLLFNVFLICMLSACSTSHKQDLDPLNIHDLENMQDAEPRGTTTASQLSQIRIKALEDTAMSLAAQSGLSWESKQINTRLDQDRWHLETIYNFNGMMLSHGILPPVLVEGDNSLNLADPNTIRVADKTYKILQPARFATTPPNWRDYLWVNYPKPEMPNRVLLPKNRYERKIWARAIRLGWQRGVQQGDTNFQQNLARLKRDYQGMILYRKLLQQHMITAPFVSRTELGVTGDGNDMRINDQVLRITEQSRLQTDSTGWRAIVVKQ